MNKKKRGVLTGMSIGDGHIPKNGYGITITHCAKQYEYIYHKALLLRSVCGGKLPRVVDIDNNGYDGHTIYKSDKYFRILRKDLYKDNVKTISESILNRLTPQGIAIWWMDDGSLYMKRHKGKIHAREGILSTYIPLDHNIMIANWFKENYNVTLIPVRHRTSYRLRINTTNLKDFLPIIEPYIIPSMLYKIDMKY